MQNANKVFKFIVFYDFLRNGPLNNSIIIYYIW